MADTPVIDRRLAGEPLARLGPTERTAAGWPLHRLADALPVLRPDLARALAPVLRCRLAGPADSGSFPAADS